MDQITGMSSHSKHFLFTIGLEFLFTINCRGALLLLEFSANTITCSLKLPENAVLFHSWQNRSPVARSELPRYRVTDPIFI